ncbi:MAG: bifunctional UDP-N-acetylglucosamine diphosphorylase/glucosamine-1-phosphate N-acetyltransferase GlmU [Actinomycetales bacterium]|nr:bifunctional UDP-N-acetylglucosamine diphosphorylase/glucosamine-1-phosphate N-acetyltransferase GlmU [Actinomycetales bacterium]
MTTASAAAVVVLAAGEGTRMRSATPKVLHTMGGRSLLGHALAAATDLEPERVCVVVRHDRDRVAAHARELLPSVLVADQDEIPGTGRAVRCALAVLDGAADADAARQGRTPSGEGGLEGPVVVMAGDVPLLDGGTLRELLEAHVADRNAVTVLTTRVDDPTGYGRIVRDGSGQVARIVEHKDADPAELEIDEINSSIYVFDAAVLRAGLARLGRHNAQGEVYLTDVIAIARSEGEAVRALQIDDPIVVAGVNDRAQLAELRAALNRRILTDWMIEGVTVVDPATTWVDVDVELERDVTLLPGTQLHGRTTVAAGATIGPDTTLVDVVVEAGATVTRSHATSSRIGPGAVVGPFSYLRPGTDLGPDGKIGAYVETKNARIGEHAKVPHLSYVGDAVVGEHSNVGAGTIFANYDGVTKSSSVVGDHVRIGSNNVLVAPVTLGDGAYTGAGSVIRRDVPPGALGVSQSPQRNVDGWVFRRRPGTSAAEAAAAALGVTPPDPAETTAGQAEQTPGDRPADGTTEGH